eukprot:GFUD01024695.1.p1 GENE.GFUD01024695.1~~GFUD01024695.1.p1  ORF type:complete len:3073 (+),score=1009.79 GFUD01024695.1:162-9221(+)
MEEMRKDLEKMKEFIMKQGDEIVKLKKNGTIQEEDNCRLESESELSQRLYDIEFQLSEQKRSTTKITKLCMAAIKALEKLEQKPGGLEVGSFDESSINSKESESSVDPQMIKTLCEQMDVINKLLIKVDDDIEAVDQKAEDSLADGEKITEKIKAMEKANKDRCDTLLGEMRALLVSKTYATREDLSRGIKTIPIPISKEEVAEMIVVSREDLTKSIKMIPIPMKKEEVLQMIERSREDLSHSIKTIPIPMKKEEVLQMIERSREDLSRSIKTIPIPMKKEEVSQMIELATSNFLRTVHAETANCVEKTQDCEEFVKTELEKMKNSVEDTDSFVRNEARQIQENTEKNMKEVTRTLANLTEQQQNKANSQNVDAYEKLNKRLDTEITNFAAMMKDLPKEENKGMDEAKFNARMERLGKEISLMKAKQTELCQNFENSLSKQTFLETQNKNIARTLEKHQDEVQKVKMVEKSLDELSQKIEANSKLYESAVEECQKKIAKTEMDDLKNGMEKERCKINYFQDKISNIAKSVEGIKIENNNMRDKFCADIESHDANIKSQEKVIKQQTSDISENSNALKGITLDSIGKIKEVANNCVQVEMNIRSIRDKSILFDNDIKEIKDQISQLKYESGNQQQISEKDVLKLVMQKDEEIKAVTDGIQNVKKKLKLNTADLNNIREDKRTKESENEERQLSLEQNLSDVRSYVEGLLNETNKQLTNIAIEVENADLKISKCASDIGEVFHKHANHTGDFTFVIQNLEEKFKDLQEFGTIKHGEFLEKILELRSSFVDTQSGSLDKLKLSNDSIENIREECNSKIEKFERQIGQNLETNNIKLNKTNQSFNEIKEKSQAEINDIIGKFSAFKADNELAKETNNIKLNKTNQSFNEIKEKSQAEINDIIGKFSSFKADHELANADIKKCIEEGRDSYSKVNADIVCLQKAEESHQNTLKNVKENLAKFDNEVKGKVQEDNDKVNVFKADLEKSHKIGDSLRKELDTRMENLRKNILEMIGLNELKTSEIDNNLKQTNDIVNDIKIVQSNIQMNIETKLKATKDNFESVINDSLKTKNSTSSEMESKFATLKKDVEHVKNEIRIGDLESFKSVVNNTTETHNKLISSIQKSVDLIVCEKTILESQTAVLDSKVSDMLCEKDTFENTMKESLQKECEESEKVKEQMKNVQLNLRDIHEKIEACTKLDSNLKNLTKNIQEAKNEFTLKVQENASKMTDLEELLNCELKNLKVSVTSSGQTLHENFMQEFTEVSKNIQEKSLLADTQLNEALEMIHNHTRVIDNLSDSVGQVNKSSDLSDSQIQKLELKLTSYIDELSKLDEFATSTDLKKVERAINEKSDRYEANEVDNKIETLKQEISYSVKELSSKDKSLEQMLRDFQSKFANLTDVSGLPDEIQMLSSKVHQQKAKLIDMEANITMQERSTNKLSDDVKKINGSFNKMEEKVDKMNKLGTVNEDTSTKMSNLHKQNDLTTEEVRALSEIKTKFDSKANSWDRKAESSEIDKLNIIITDEVNKIQKEIKDILKSNEEIKTKQIKEVANQSKITKGLEGIFIGKEQFNALDLNFSRLSDQVQKTNGTTTGNIVNIEKKISNFEASRQEATIKLSDLLEKNENINKEMVNLSGFKTKYESKINAWDNKVDPADIKKLDTFVNEELKKMKKDIQYILENNDEIKANLKTNSKHGDQETILKNLENKFIQKDEIKELDLNFSKLSSDVKTNKDTIAGNISTIEKKISDLEVFKQETSSELSDLLKKNIQIKEEVTSVSVLKSKFDSKANIWDAKADPEEVKKINTFVNEEVKKMKKDINNIMEKNDEINTNIKSTSKNENQEIMLKSLENKLTDNISQIENKISTFEASRLDTAKNVSELLEKNEKLNGEIVNLSGLKSKFESKVNIWDAKADPEEVKKINTFVNEEVKKVKKDIEYMLEKNDEINANLKNTSKNENQEMISNNLESRLTGYISKSDNKIATLEASREDTANSLTELLKKIEKLNEEMVSLSGLKSNFESKTNIWDSKANPEQVKKIDTFVNEEVKKLKKDIQYILEKNDEISNDLKKTSQNENQELISKNLENTLTQNIAQIENKMAILEASRQENTTKFTELTKSNDKLNKEMVNIYELKSKFDSKVDLWDSKVNQEEVKKIDTFVNEEVKKIKKDIGYILEKNDEISNDLKKTSQNENQELISKNLENTLTQNIAQIENKMAILEASRQENSSKFTELTKKNESLNEEIIKFSYLKCKFESKVDLWDSKADPEEVKKIDTFVNEEVKKLKKDIGYILEKNDEISDNLKSTSQNKDQETISKSLENRLNGNIAQIENKMAIFEASRQDTSTKLSELSKKNDKINEEIVNLSGLKSKFDSKVNIWDSKVDPAEVIKVDKFVNEEVTKMKMDIKSILEKNDEISVNVKNLSENGNQETISKNLDNKFISKDVFKVLDLNVSKLTEDIKKVNEKSGNLSNTCNLEEKVIKLENCNIDFNNKFVNLVEKNTQINDELVSLSGLKSKFDSKANFWDAKSDPSEVKRIDALVADEVKKLQKNIDNILDKNNEVQKSLKDTNQNGNLESALKDLEVNFIRKQEFAVLEKNNNIMFDDIKKINGSISGHISKVDDKMAKFDISNSDLCTKFADLSKKNDKTMAELVTLSNLTSKFDSKVDSLDGKAESAEIKKLKTFIDDEVKKLQKNIDHILGKNEEMFSNLKNKNQDSNQDILAKDLAQTFITKEEFTFLDINFSKLSEIVENLQGEFFSNQQEESSQLDQFETSMKTLKTQVEAMTKDSKHTEPSSSSSSGITEMVKTIQTTISSLETNMNSLKADVPSRKEFEKIQDLVEDNHTRGREGHGYENALTSIDKQRRGWEEAREKAEEMSQIFDSLIITNDRPYVSCGLDLEMTEPGLLEFSQFELINKFAFDTDTNQFSLLEPGVYLLQMAGSLQGGSLIAKLVSEDIAVEFMTLEGGANGSFKSRSTIFTIEDDDKEDPEGLLVELVAQGDGDCRLDSDFSFLMYKISEVTTADQLEC